MKNTRTDFFRDPACGRRRVCDARAGCSVQLCGQTVCYEYDNDPLVNDGLLLFGTPQLLDNSDVLRFTPSVFYAMAFGPADDERSTSFYFNRIWSPAGTRSVRSASVIQAITSCSMAAVSLPAWCCIRVIWSMMAMGRIIWSRLQRWEALAVPHPPVCHFRTGATRTASIRLPVLLTSRPASI